jgi:hypothetical protein
LRCVVLVCSSFVVCLLTHNSNTLVCSFNCHGLDLSDGYSINGSLVLSALSLFCLIPHGLLLLFKSKKSSLLSLSEIGLVAFVLSLCNVITCDINSGVGESKLVCYPLDLLLLHLLSDSGPQILGSVLRLLQYLLLLDFRELLGKPTTMNKLFTYSFSVSLVYIFFNRLYAALGAQWITASKSLLVISIDLRLKNLVRWTQLFCFLSSLKPLSNWYISMSSG